MIINDILKYLKQSHPHFTIYSRENFHITYIRRILLKFSVELMMTNCEDGIVHVI